MRLAKCGYTNPVANRPIITLDRVINTEDCKNLEREKNQLSPTLHQWVYSKRLTLGNHQKISFDWPNIIIGINQKISSNFQEKLAWEEWRRLDINENSHLDEDYNSSECITQDRTRLPQTEVYALHGKKVSEWESFILADH
jgi:hypothetical protein